MEEGRQEASEAAKALSDLGASIGGKARAEKLSADERRAIARHAAEVRWGVSSRSSVPNVSHHGELPIGDVILPCAVLDDGTRLFTQRGMFVAMGRHKNPSKGPGTIDNRPGFVAAKNLEPFFSDKLRRSWMPVKFHSRGGVGGNIALGYKAELLPEVCNVYLDALEAGVLRGRQKEIAKKCKVLQRAFASVGIIALIDEATGYQADRAIDALNQILQAYISEELRPWTSKFPNEFFKQLYRLRRWDYREGSNKRYRVVGKLVNKLIYEPLPPGVLDKLKKKNPPNDKGYRTFKHHQFLTADIGDEHLNKQLLEVVTLMRVSENQPEFERLFAKAFPKQGKPDQMLIEFSEEVGA